jgi:SAM-dependent methyltransferase
MTDTDAHPSDAGAGGSGVAGSEQGAPAFVNMHTDRPTPARMYDYFLGGKDNFKVDRENADKVSAALGATVTHDIVWENRRFLQRAVRWLAQAGIDQFIDLGAGLPTQGNVHEIAQQVNPEARVVYVDYDPIVLAHARALLVENHTTTVITADLRDPRSVLAHPDLRELIDFSRPVAVLFIALFHFITDEENPAEIISVLREAMAPGSYLALSHLTTDGPPADQVAHTERVYQAATSPIVFRPREAIESMFSGFTFAQPGLVRPWQWHPELQGPELAPGEISPRTDWLFAGVASRDA